MDQFVSGHTQRETHISPGFITTNNPGFDSNLAETLDAEDLGVRHLLVHPVTQVLKVGQAPLVLVYTKKRHG
jgi:hypothetical protein